MPASGNTSSLYKHSDRQKPADNEKLPAPASSENNTFLSDDAFLLTATAIAAIAGFLYGYDTGIISGALL